MSPITADEKYNTGLEEYENLLISEFNRSMPPPRMIAEFVDELKKQSSRICCFSIGNAVLFPMDNAFGRAVLWSCALK